MTRDTSLDDLDARFRGKAIEFLARCTEAGVPLRIINTLRTDAEHQADIAAGRSWTANSKHLGQPPDGKALAMDVCLYSVYQLNGPDKLQWDASDPAWQIIGDIAERLGLHWGGRWKERDMGHVEWAGD